MNTTKLIALSAVIGTCSFATAEETTPAAENQPKREIPAAALKKFDTDGDGKLSPDEAKAMREARQAEMIKKFDKDGDGKLSEEERKGMQTEMMAKRKALLEKYDANKNGKLDPDEIKAARDAGEELPMGGHGPGGKHEGKIGPEGKGGPKPE